MKFHQTILTATVLSILFNSCGNKTNVTSPSGDIEVKVTLNENGNAKWQLNAYGNPIIAPSSTGLEAKETNLSDGFEIIDTQTNSQDEVWTQPWGENKTIRDNHKELAVKMENKEGVKLTLRIKAFDDGVGFRYEYETGLDSLTITAEKTGFEFASDGMSWSIPANFETYELPVREQSISKTENANTPFTFCIGSIYGSIHEAALYDFPEMNLYSDDSLSFRSELAPMPQGFKARVPGKFNTPWRSVQIAESAVGLINSSLILNLNEPCKIEDTSWIQPQKYVGVWWGMHLGTHSWTCDSRHGATTENAIRHIDFAAANNIDGVLFEGWNEGWETWGGRQHFDYCKAYPDFDIEKIAAYAKEKGVELWMHNETGGSIYEYEAALDKAFSMYENLGVHTVKTGYAGGMPGNIRHHSQRGVQHYQKVVEAAAAHKLMIDAHEPIKETGIRRTWPNMMTREGARGMEWNAWSDGNSAEYLCQIPFVRLLSGPMDYTPGVFDIYYKTASEYKTRKEWNGDYSKTFIKTTLARQIANWVLLYSPLQMACDLIENYEGHPAFQFFRDFDADCDWSKALAGEIGDYIVIARRSGDKFFLGAGTNDQARTIDISLDFLEPGKTYAAAIYADDTNAPVISQPDGTKSADKTAYRIINKTVTSKDSLTIEMAQYGGQAISFIPAE